MVSSNFPSRPFRLEESCWTRYQDVANNTSHISGELWIRKNSYSPSWSNNRSAFSFDINGGQVAAWDFTYDFRNSDALRLAYVEIAVPHNPDGTKTIPISASCNADGLGYTALSSNMEQPTIPRASTLSLPNGNWVQAGTAAQGGTGIYMVAQRASSSFTHVIDWYFGSATGRAMTNMDVDGTWYPDKNLLNQIPNATSGVGKLRTHTYSGGNMIGYTEVDFGIVAPGDVIPTWSSVSLTENNSAVPDVVGTGRYVQGISKLKGVITGASGVYGSSITSISHSAAGETVSGDTGVFFNPIGTAGTDVPVVQTITDSRGRSKSQTTNIYVLPYSTPVITKATVARVNTSNALDPVGTRLKISITAAVQSLINGSERNRMTLLIYTKAPSASSWNNAITVVADSATLSYNSDVYLEGPFSVAQAYDVRVELVDKFNTTRADTTLATGEVFQHWGAGMGVGKYWERGMLDVNGAIYHGGGAIVEPLGVILPFGGTTAPTGWMLCQGQEISRTTYSTLFDVLGTRFGTGNGSSTFNLPDLRRRVPAGYMANDADFGTLGGRGGHRDIPSHTHLLSSDGLSHGIGWGDNNGSVHFRVGDAALSAYPGSSPAGSNGQFTKQNDWNKTAPEGNPASTNNLPPYITLNYIIRVL